MKGLYEKSLNKKYFRLNKKHNDNTMFYFSEFKNDLVVITWGKNDNATYTLKIVLKYIKMNEWVIVDRKEKIKRILEDV